MPTDRRTAWSRRMAAQRRCRRCAGDAELGFAHCRRCRLVRAEMAYRAYRRVQCRGIYARLSAWQMAMQQRGLA